MKRNIIISSYETKPHRCTYEKKMEVHFCSTMCLLGHLNDSVSTEPVHETTAVDDDERLSHQPSAPVLPDDLIIEILIRVPARSLLQLKCVCKTWKILISDPQFANHHLRTSTANPSMTQQQRLVTSFISKRSKILSWPFKSHLEKPSNPHFKPFTFSLSNDHRYRILGSCNGLICLYNRTDHHASYGYVQLWNPLTRLTSKTSPIVEGAIGYHGFGYDPVNDKYKVLVGFVLALVYGGLLELVTKVYTFGEDENPCWRTIQNFPYTLSWKYRRWPWSSGKFVSNTLNWLEKSDVSSNKWVIISFDLEKETYSEVLLPKIQYDNNDGELENTCDHPVLDVLKNCLSVCFSSYENGGVVWLMKEYGVFESWTKLMVVKPYQKLTYSAPLCISQNGGLVPRNFSFSESLLYEPNTNMFCLPRILSRRRFKMDYNVYHESLVSPP